MATTTNYGWTTPDNTDLVKDGASAIRTLGSSIDTTLKAQIDAQIPDAVLTTTGDVIYASGASTPARLGIGSTGQVLGVASGLPSWTTPSPLTNKIINGDFGVWQRGTSFSNPANATYTADRWFVELDGTGTTRTMSQQTFTPGTAPVAGYEGTYFFRWNTSVAGTGNTIQALSTRLEDIRTFAGQTVTFSFWAKADASRAVTVYAYQQSTGGSGTVTTTVGTATLTTSWARYTMTVALPSLAGITIGTNSNLQIRIAMPTGTTMTCDFWGMQLQAGSLATPFQTATGTVQGELAACQRYYWRNSTQSGTYALGFASSTTGSRYLVNFPVSMRVSPTAIEYGAGINATDLTTYNYAFTALTLNSPTLVGTRLDGTVASGQTAFRPQAIFGTGGVDFIAFTAEL